MSEKRFRVMDNDSKQLYCIESVDGEMFSMQEIVDLLNEQQATIDKLDQENADLLGARIKAQEEWEKCTDKLKAKILEQQATIKKQDERIKELESILADDIVRKSEIKEAWKQRTEKR